MTTLFTNNAIGELTSAMLASAADVDVNLGAGEGDLFPIVAPASGNDFYGTLIDISGNREIVKCTLRASGSNILTVVRAQDGTTAQAFSTGDKFQLRVTAKVLEDFQASIVANTALNTALDARVVLIETGVEDPGNKMWFWQAAAPTAGWVIDVTVEDVLLAVKDQSAGGLAYDAAGGTEGGSWTPTGHVHTSPAHTHTGPSHTHTGPSHTHTGPAHVHTGPSHTHTMGTHVHTMGSHSHQWYNYRSGLNDQSGDGVTIDGSNSNLEGINTASDTSRRLNKDYSTSSVDPGNTNSTDPGDTNSSGTGNTGSAGTGATGSDGTGATGASGTDPTGAFAGDANVGSSSEPSTDRPDAAIGIICTKS